MKLLLEYNRFIDILGFDDKVRIGGGVTDRCFVVGRRAKERGIEVNGIFREVEVVDRDAKATGFLLAIADSDVEKASVRVGDFEGVRILLLNDVLHFFRNGIFG